MKKSSSMQSRGATLSDAHADELRLAMEAAALWRTKFHNSKASAACGDTAPQTPTTKASESLCTSTCASSGNSEVESSEAGSEVFYDSPAASSELSAGNIWVFVAVLSEISLYLRHGLRAPLKTAAGKSRVRLYTGPWGRTGLCKHVGSGLVVVDAATALAAGAKVTGSKGKVVLSPGSSIPASAFRKVLRIADGATLYEQARPAASGPDQPRKRISKRPISGEIVSWKGQVGWIQPAVRVPHPQASRHHGHLYIHQRDVLEGQSLWPGQAVKFHVYEDGSGLGAELCHLKPDRQDKPTAHDEPVHQDEPTVPITHLVDKQQRLCQMRERVDWSAMNDMPTLVDRCASFEEWRSISCAMRAEQAISAQ